MMHPLLWFSLSVLFIAFLLDSSGIRPCVTLQGAAAFSMGWVPELQPLWQLRVPQPNAQPNPLMKLYAKASQTPKIS